MEAFLLGISNGTICVAYCAPILVPYLLAERSGPLASAGIVGRFLLGRLAGYLIFALVAFALSASLTGVGGAKSSLVGSAYVVLSVFLVIYGFRRTRSMATCAAEGRLGSLIARTWRPATPALLGFLTGVSLCPPFLIAFTAAVERGSLMGSVLFFCLFFCGTAVFFLPFPLIGSLRRIEAFHVIGRLAAGLMGLYYFYAGLVILLSVIK